MKKTTRTPHSSRPPAASSLAIAATTGAAQPWYQTVSPETLELARASLEPNTVRAYRTDWEDFKRWCERRGASCLPADPSDVGDYLKDLAKRLKVATIQRRYSSISRAHKEVRCENPIEHPGVRAVMRGIRRTLGIAPTKKSPLGAELLARVVERLPATLRGRRDRALLLLGFAGFLRRTELVALNVEDLSFVTRGCVIAIRRSKTDPEGRGAYVGIPFGAGIFTCPVQSLQGYLTAAGIEGGAVFRSVDRRGMLGGRLNGRAVAKIVKRAVARVGLDPTPFAGHSLRSGAATTAYENGASERGIMAQGRWRSVAVARDYASGADVWKDNPSTKLGL